MMNSGKSLNQVVEYILQSPTVNNRSAATSEYGRVEPNLSKSMVVPSFGSGESRVLCLTKNSVF